MKKNNFTKNKFLLCFRPVAMESRTIKSSKSEKNFESMVSEKENSKDKTSNRMRKVKSARNLLSKVAKAVFLDTSLNKSRNGKVVQDPNRSQREIFSEKLQKISILAETKSKVGEEKNNHNQTRNLDPLSSSVSSSSSTLTYSSSILSSSSTSSSSSSSSSTSTWSIPSQQDSSESKSSSWISFSGRDKSFRINSLDRKEKKIDDTKSSSSSSNFYYICGLCLLLFSLSVLIFCGKVSAILCTSTWFYFVSTTTRPHVEELSGNKSSSSTLEMEEEDVQSKLEKKKVIMEGFLGMNNNHHKILSLQH
ncbi:uncharacterized serine-rich protein C215.13 isoform X2 [Papaver somniferum]|uniref:uncharacterized serine-rich protein C215.13 isoform X2 n=1 Tax=Papaver somniferum TaxID=3469 RepID=UPI000E6F9E7F|nr:uncharacterized serine-rich protein C215.13 isoform X2 [Papaver somniferum]